MTARLIACIVVVFIAAIAAPLPARAQDSADGPADAIAQAAKRLDLARQALTHANAMQYNQARTMLALVGEYTRYDQPHISENTWLRSQNEALELELPRMRRSAERLNLTETERQVFTAMFDALDALLAASLDMNEVLKRDDVAAANRIYIDRVDDDYNDIIRAAETILSETTRTISLTALKLR